MPRRHFRLLEVGKKKGKRGFALLFCEVEMNTQNEEEASFECNKPGRVALVPWDRIGRRNFWGSINPSCKHSTHANGV